MCVLICFCHVHEQYEKAAAVLRKHGPPVVLAKVDAYDERNKEIKDKYQVHAYPTIKIIENAGNNVRGYGGPRDAGGIVEYLKKQVGPASIELRSAEEAAHAIGDKGVVLVGFPTVMNVHCFLNTLRMVDVNAMHACEHFVAGRSFPQVCRCGL
jgi:protein disulfide-isomerase A1